MRIQAWQFTIAIFIWGENMLEKLRELNKDIPFFDANSPEFAPYGRIITDLDAAPFLEAAQSIELPENKAAYNPSREEFESLPEAKIIKERYFGTLPIQIGYTYGHANFLNATEWHASTEINIAITDLVIIVGTRSDLVDNKIDSSVMKAFYVKKGTVLETYATCLHFCPCEVQSEGFGWVVALPLGTNTPLDEPCDDKLLNKKNKWLLAHADNKALIATGVTPGVFGKNFEIKY